MERRRRARQPADQRHGLPTETWLFWDPSVDAVTPRFAITYLVYLNGVLDNHVVGFERDILYGTPLSFNTYTVIAVDEAGNESAPATIVVDNR
jgi:hypothetical protein